MPTDADDRRLPTAAPAGVSAAEAPTVDIASGKTADAHDSDAQDSFDEVLKQVVRAGPALDTLGVGSELVGRFALLRVLGEGGMGTVYVARDATLGREVAIKVHHSAGGANRLRREAVAMARLAHPNVVTVFEVGDVAGRPFVVMEYIAGTTLRAWLTAAPRTVHEILAMVIAAGDGLAAAHDAGLVHRDIKPENVLIGADGRARVGDFGLARELDSSEEARGVPSAATDSMHTPVTQTGAVLGTPAYMAPEQFAGEPVDARADQFSFCVTAWEALWGERPFTGSSFAQLHAAITSGNRRAPPSSPRVPVRVRLALERGLSVDPAARFPTMRALLDAIRPRRLRRRWLLAWGAVALVPLGITAFALLRRPAEPSCEAAGVAELFGVRTDLPAQLAVHSAPRLAVRAESVSRAYFDAFRSDARQACEAGRAHEWSPELVARSRMCFAIVGRTAALQLAMADPRQPLDVLHRLRRLPPEAHCRNQTHLASRPSIPADPVKLDAVIDASATLAVGFDSIDSHDVGLLQRSLDLLQVAPAHDDPGIAAGILVLRGSLALQHGRVADARKLFVDAYYAGRAIDDEVISSAALGNLIGRGGDLGLESATIQEWLRTALSDADRTRARSPWLAGRIYTVAAQAADTAGDAKAAQLFIARAREVLAPNDPPSIETYAVEGAVLMWSGHVADGVKAYETAIAQTTAYYGEDDPQVAAVLSNYAASLLDVEHLNDALAVADRAATIIDNLTDPDDERIDGIRVNLAAILISTNQDDEALRLLDTARANDVKRLGEASLAVANIDSNLAAIYNARGEHDRAITALSAALATDEKLLGRDHVEVASVLYNLAASYRYKHAYPAALEAARRAAGIQGAKSPGSDRHRLALTMAASIANEARQFAQALALTQTALGFDKPAEGAQTRPWAELERAIALLGVGRAAEARALLTGARDAYVGLGMTQRVEQIDALLGRR